LPRRPPGPRSSAIIEASREAELVVVGNRGHGETASALLGSVAYAVTSHASCPVVVVRGDGHTDLTQEHPIVVGIDGSRSGVHAGYFAAEMASRVGAAVTVVGVWDVPAIGGLSTEFAHRIGVQEMHAKAESQMTRLVDLAVTKMSERHPGTRITGRVVQGSPVIALREAAEGAGLLVVGTRGRGGFAGLLLGSVSHRLIHDIGCPVAVVR
jgi:nucleotide-binding universal stress UspA family protein